eukprot:TRINITY_DN8041_c0_g1_i4.p1 TRINITY_DN8041_c0_g1~~TRINITY_DN8041_c0_g1_i4.p1  ORF type:complete len:550 (-),score=69.29 TRINITY_DN8041_c0_g1_i4:284-1933(-)
MSRPFGATAAPGHRSFNPSRISELLDALKNEYETMNRDVSLCKMQRDDYDRKLQQQLQESQTIQAQILDLDRGYHKMKQKYEEEIMILRRQLGQGNGASGEGLSSLNRNSIGEKRPLPSLEGSQNLENLAKRHRELPPPLNPPPANSGSGSLSISQIARHAGAPKKASIDSPKQPPPSPHPHSHNPISHPHQGPMMQHSPPAPPQSMPSLPPPSNTSSPALPNPSLPLVPMDKNFSNGMTPKSRKRQSENDPEPDKNDWVVGYNPAVPRKLDVVLDHDMEHDSVVCCVNFSYDGKYLATGCNHSAQIFDVKTGNKVHVFRDKPDSDADLYIRSVCFAPDGKFLATGAEDRTVKLWDIEKEQIWYNFTGHELDIYSLDFSPDGRFVISGSGDKKIKVWKVEDGKCLHTLGDEISGPKDGVTSVAISPDGRQIAAGSLDRIVRVWDTETGSILTQYEGHSDSVYSVAFSPDGKTLASGSLDKTLKLWDLAPTRNRRCKGSLGGHRDFVLSVAFSPDGNWLVSGSKDRSVQFWDHRSSVTHMILQGHRNSGW